MPNDSLSLKDIFPDSLDNSVVASWFSGTLEISLGEFIKYENEMPKKYNRAFVLIIEQGKIVNQSMAENYRVVNCQIDITNIPIEKVLNLYHKNIPLHIKSIEPKSEILDTTSFRLRVNGDLPKFELISELLERNYIPFESFYPSNRDTHLPFETWNPSTYLSLQPIEMCFSPICRFRDIYHLASWLKEFGIEQIYPSRTQFYGIVIGSTLFQTNNLGKYVLAESISLDSFLRIDPCLDTQKVLDMFFTNRLEYVDDDVDDDDEYSESEENVFEIYNDEYSRNWKRDTFDAMTDGQLGDWKDFPGDIDDLLDWTGRSQ
jgi:hypothetical protein